MRTIKFEITDLGFATLDDLKIGEFAPPVKVTVPELVGLTAEDAELAIVNEGLLVGSVLFENSNTIPAGSVLEQSLLAGASVDEGSVVNIVVSLGTTISIPSLVGISRIDAEEAIEAAGLTIGTIVEEHHDSIPPGEVISQDPDAGTLLSSEDPVNLVVSLGPVPPPEIVVNSTGDEEDQSPGDGICETQTGNGVCSLRAAIQEVNALTGLHRITFGIAGNGPHSIKPQSELPAISKPVIIDGYSQSGSSLNLLESGSNAILMIELDGTEAGPGARGLLVIGGDSTIRGLVINRFQGPGIHLVNGGKNKIQGNLIGTDSSGTVGQGNGGGGIDISNSSETIIGGLNPEDRNVIANNGFTGIGIQNSNGIIIQGNLIGTDRNGTEDLGNASAGILLGVTSDSIVGGESIAARNIISGNGRFGVDISSSAKGCVVRGNFIGTNVNGALGIGNRAGVAIAGGDNRILNNLISANQGAGIQISGFTQENGTSGNQIQGNIIGTDISKTQDLGNVSHGILFWIGSVPGFPPVNNFNWGRTGRVGECYCL